MAIRYHHQLQANCTPEFVWQAFAEVDRWPQWNKIIGSGKWVAGTPWQPGSKMRIQVVSPINFTLEPEVVGAKAPEVVHWQGKGMGVNAEIMFRFVGQADGTTAMEVLEEFTGAATMFVTERMKRDVVTVFDSWLKSLKDEAERLAGPRTQNA